MWVPGCSTGEEAYSIAILLLEAVAEVKRVVRVQIFATDIDVEAIERARSGKYPDSISVDVSPERLERYFVASEGGYQITASVRDTLVFAKQDVTRDPPFSKVDLISCRNLLIYLDGELQKRLLPVFHYALRPGGYIFLGSSETLGEVHTAFATVDKKWKLFRRDKGSSDRLPIDVSMMPAPRGASPGSTTRGGGTAARAPERLRDVAERALLERHSPAAVVINSEGDALYIHGRTGKYLEPASGEASSNLIKMAREGVRFELASGVRKVLAGGEPVRYEGLRVKSGGSVTTVNMTIEPLSRPEEAKGLLLVLFEEAASRSVASDVAPLVSADEAEQRIADLDRELSAKEEFLRTTVEELETSNEELKSTNEELQSSNEELQSTVEELETSKEELQSLNEELVTVNTELQQKVEQLSQVNNDMNNLLAGTGIGTLFVDHQLRIQRFTPAITDIIKLIRSDVGRPLSDIAVRLKGNPDLVGMVEDVLSTLASKEAEVEVLDGRPYVMRVQPYRTLNNVIEGAVITFVDVSAQRDLRRELERYARVAEDAREYAQSVVDSASDPLLVLDGDLTVISANQAFYSDFGLTPESTVGKPLDSIGSGQWALPGLAKLLLEVLPAKREVSDFTIRYASPDGDKTLVLAASELARTEGKRRLIVLTVTKIETA